MSGWYPPPSRPRAVDGGLRARSARGAIGRTWWSARFTGVLEEIGLGSRLQRGRNYARRGQVISLEVVPGAVISRVQGSRARPYRVRVGLPAYGKAEWGRLERALADDAWYAARLLAGEMPEDIEEVFAGAGLPLFPASAGEVTMDCSCPDWEVPCKHIAAVFYLLAEAFDEDPFALLAWRGRERDDLLANLRAARSGPAPGAGRPGREDDAGAAGHLESFFSLQAELPLAGAGVRSRAALLDQLPGLGLPVRGQPLADLLRPAYRALDGGAEAPEGPGAGRRAATPGPAGAAAPGGGRAQPARPRRGAAGNAGA